MTAPIEARDLTKRFGRFTAVDRVSFGVNEGEIFGYLGANGAGKSTTIRMLCGLLRPSEGSATVGGYDVTLAPARARARLGYMSQKFSLYLDLSVHANLRFFAGAYAIDRPGPRIAELAARLDVERLLDARTGDLPGGTRQRVALACALLHAPSVVFLDEPTAGVDPASRCSFWAIIRELAAGGTTVLVTTHYLDEAEGCDRVGLMVDGKLAALDTPAELKRQFVPEPLLEVRTERRAAIRAALADHRLDGQVFGRALHVRARDPEATGALLAGIDPEVKIERLAPTLEDVFLEVVKRNGGDP